MDKSDMSVVARHLKTAPVDLKAIFVELGLRYDELWLDDGASGSISRSGDVFSVVVNALEIENAKAVCRGA